MSIHKIRNAIKDITGLLKHYSFGNFKRPESMVIVRFDTFLNNTGLTDRLRHILSIYEFCRNNGKKFKIYHPGPFNLENILVPAEYDWRLAEGALSNSYWRTNIIKIYSYYKALGITEEEEALLQAEKLDNLLKTDSQFHIYGNAHIYKQQWSRAFNELFKPSKRLSERLTQLHLPEKYEAITLRFQQLLGDFKESWFQPLPEDEAELLINKCIQEIKRYHDSGNNSEERILVTSDSRRFLDRISQELPYVITIPGDMAHFSQRGNSEEVYMKSFVDLYALMNAVKITLFQTGKMYLSGFPEFAAVVGNKPFGIHTF